MYSYNNNNNSFLQLPSLGHTHNFDYRGCEAKLNVR